LTPEKPNPSVRRGTARFNRERTNGNTRQQVANAVKKSALPARDRQQVADAREQAVRGDVREEMCDLQVDVMG